MLEPVTIWFDSEQELRQLCGDAQSQARSEKAQEFCAQMMVKANQEGLQMQISFAQLKWLCQIADWEIPARRS